MLLKTAFLVLRKDFAIEIKSHEILSTTLFFAVSCVLVFSFAFVNEGQAPPGCRRPRFCGSPCCLPGRWRSAGRSSANATARRCGRCCWRRRRVPALYVGKLLGILALLGLTELLLVPMIALLFQAPLLARPPLLLPLLACGTIGFAAVGTLFAAMLMRARTRDVMLPILLYPITIPVIIAGVRGTAALLASPPDEPTAIMWLAILLSLRCRVRDAGALDVRAVDDGVET